MREYEERESKREKRAVNNHVRSMHSSKWAGLLTENGYMKKNHLPTDVKFFITRNLSNRHF